MKFKVFDKKNKEFVSDDLYDTYFLDRNGDLYLYAQDYHDTTFNKCEDEIPIFSTEQKDIDGNEIYEGDRVDLDYNYLGVITVTFKDAKYNISDYNLFKCKIIGSKYTDPELKEKG